MRVGADGYLRDTCSYIWLYKIEKTSVIIKKFVVFLQVKLIYKIKEKTHYL